MFPFSGHAASGLTGVYQPAAASADAVPALAALVNRVNHSDAIAAWSSGASALMRDLAARRLI